MKALRLLKKNKTESRLPFAPRRTLETCEELKVEDPRIVKEIKINKQQLTYQYLRSPGHGPVMQVLILYRIVKETPHYNFGLAICGCVPLE